LAAEGRQRAEAAETVQRLIEELDEGLDGLTRMAAGETIAEEPEGAKESEQAGRP
ncbi:MAG: hypothetical protein JST53_14345, partial [Actinobacteria bacterium]|nr:hypothetical protein [Actinomycetota bacterium]